MNKRTLVCGAIIIVSLCIAGVRFFGGSGTINKATRRDLANELAAWIAKEAAAGAKGRTVILAPPAEKGDPFPGQLAKRLEAQMKGSGFDPIETVVVPYNLAIESTGEPVTREAFLNALNAQAGAAVVVSLVGVPRLTAQDLPAGNRPRLIVASTVIMPYLRSLPDGLIDFTIEVKRDAPNDLRTDASLGELSNYFVLHRPK